ncbi:MAG: hypothetical protein ACI91O_001404 [Candidatus Poriferisodalaceae bacterium]
MTRREDSYGRGVITLKCDPADAELVWKSLVAATVYDPEKPIDERRVDALVAVADSYLANGPTDRSGLDRTQVLVHSHGEAGAATLADGSVLDFATTCRLECDASHMTIDVAGEGNEVPGRNSSGVSAGLRRSLMLGDRGCRWPGCLAEHHLHAHHVVHRLDGGPTVLDNLILLCGHHHRVLHAHGFGIVRNVDGTWIFTRSDGSVIDSIPIQLGVPRNAQRCLVSLAVRRKRLSASRHIPRL